jgi:hypothetical protein
LLSTALLLKKINSKKKYTLLIPLRDFLNILNMINLFILKILKKKSKKNITSQKKLDLFLTTALL